MDNVDQLVLKLDQGGKEVVDVVEREEKREDQTRGAPLAKSDI